MPFHEKGDRALPGLQHSFRLYASGASDRADDSNYEDCTQEGNDDANGIDAIDRIGTKDR